MRAINEIIVHCTATKPNQRATLQDVTRWHQQRGWRTIGYHFLIQPDGRIEKGRPIEEVGAHCVGHNSHSIGVCYVGGLDHNGNPTDTRTPEQKDALLRLLTDLRHRFPLATIHSHRDFAQKACPCFDATKEYNSL